MSYVYHGYLADIYEVWVGFEGTEWGDQMRALHSAYSMGEDYAGFDEEDMQAIENILHKHLEAMKDDFVEYYAHEIPDAQAKYPEIRAQWEKVAGSKSFKEGIQRVQNSSAFVEADQRIPDWMKAQHTTLTEFVLISMPGAKAIGDVKARDAEHAKEMFTSMDLYREGDYIVENETWMKTSLEALEKVAKS